METPQIDREYPTGLAPAQRRTVPAGQLMSSAVEMAPGTPAENMGPASSVARPGYGEIFGKTSRRKRTERPPVDSIEPALR
jgi:hypothetical protein